MLVLPVFLRSLFVPGALETFVHFEANLVSVQYPFDSIIKVNIYEDLFINFSEISDLLNI